MDDYLDAHERHWMDAELLYHNQRWANADHLYGISVECGIKALMEAQGMNVPRQHLPTIAQHVQSFQFGQQGRHARIYQLPNLNAFNGWNMSQRYWNQAHINRWLVQQRRQQAEQMHNIITQARRDGWIS